MTAIFWGDYRLTKIESTSPDAFYSYFFRAIKKIKEIPSIDHATYIASLRSVVDSMSEVDISSKKRKGYLIELFEKKQ